MKKALKTATISKIAKAEEDYYKAQIAKVFAEMGVVDEHIRQTQAETAQLQAETRVILDQIQAEMGVPGLSTTSERSH